MQVKKPMLACSTQPNLEELTYPIYASFKLDGIRCTTPNDQVLSRKLKPIPNKFIQKKLARMPAGFDGELMVKGNFSDVSSSIMSFDGEPNFEYCVFDLCDQPVNKTFEARQKELIEWVQAVGKYLPIKLVEQKLCYSSSEVKAYYDLAIEQGYEGLILRSPDGLYKEGRSTLKQQWMLKLKPVEDTEATVTGFYELMRNGNEAVINNVGGQERNKQQAGFYGGNTLGGLIGISSDGTEVEVGSGFTSAQRDAIWRNQAKYFGKSFTFKFQDRFPDTNAYRFPVFKAFREDL